MLQNKRKEKRERKSKHPKEQGTGLRKKKKKTEKKEKKNPKKVSRRGSRYPTQKGKKREESGGQRHQYFFIYISICLFIYLVRIPEFYHIYIIVFHTPYSIQYNIVHSTTSMFQCCSSVVCIVLGMYLFTFKLGTRWRGNPWFDSQVSMVGLDFFLLLSLFTYLLLFFTSFPYYSLWISRV